MAGNHHQHVWTFDAPYGRRAYTGDLAIAEIAERQYGVVSRDQLLDLGLGAGAVLHRVRAGRLHRLHEGVFAVGHARLTARGRWMAAVLACGDTAVLSHRHAAALLGFGSASTLLIEVTVTARRQPRPRGICLHRTRRLDDCDRTERFGIAVTTVPRTLMDLADVLRGGQLERAFEDAERLRLLDLPAMAELWSRSRGRRGLKPIGRLLEARRPVPAGARSEMERDLVRMCFDASLDLPELNVVICGHTVDAVWRDRRLVIELDAWGTHHQPAVFESDRARDVDLQLAGYRVIRITWRRIREDPDGVLALLRSLLD
jgi:very-short-patch-repair endonuclease